MNHLGGHLFMTHVDIGALNYFKETSVYSTFLDIGCSVGWQVDEALKLGFDAYGIDGDYSLVYHKNTRNLERIMFNDFSKTYLILPKKFDLIWCVEVAEHIEEQFTDNLIKTISYNLREAGSVVFTACSKENTGIHHVNIKSKEWWIDKFNKHNMVYIPEWTEDLKKYSTMKREFIQENGMIFIKTS